jgi:hypothetical protein
VTGWALTLRFADGGARAALWNQKPGRLSYTPLKKQDPIDVDAIKQVLPGSGWTLFRVPGVGADDTFLDHIFGTTFVLTAIEQNGKETTARTPPGTWLRRVDTIWLLDEWQMLKQLECQKIFKLGQYRRLCYWAR